MGKDKEYFLIEISGNSCPTCAVLKSNVEEVVKEFPFITYYYVDDELTSRTYIEQLNLQHLPALVLISHGAVLGIAYGGQPSEIIREWLTAKVEGEKENG